MADINIYKQVYTVEIDFWQQRWADNQIGFHLPEVNPYLITYWSALEHKENSKVFVPLCGKTMDMTWLVSQKHSVLGVECSQKAVDAFFEENRLVPEKERIKEFIRYSTTGIELLLGDFFKLDKPCLENVSAVYDRASMVALPEKMRLSYVEHLTQLLPDSVNIFLVTLEYDQSLMQGPPFSVSNDEILRLYNPNFNVELLHQVDVINEQKRFKQRGLKSLIERIYKITR